jgi:hypothetical protein
MPKKIAYQGVDDGLHPAAVFHSVPAFHGGAICRCSHCCSCAGGDDEDVESLVARSTVICGGPGSAGGRGKNSPMVVARHWELGRLHINLGTFDTELQAAEAAIRVAKRACSIFEAAAKKITHEMCYWHAYSTRAVSHCD